MGLMKDDDREQPVKKIQTNVIHKNDFPLIPFISSSNLPSNILLPKIQLYFPLTERR